MSHLLVLTLKISSAWSLAVLSLIIGTAKEPNIWYIESTMIIISSFVMIPSLFMSYRLKIHRIFSSRLPWIREEWNDKNCYSRQQFRSEGSFRSFKRESIWVFLRLKIFPENINMMSQNIPPELVLIRFPFSDSSKINPRWYSYKKSQGWWP